MQGLIADIINNPSFSEKVAWKRRAFQANDLIIKEGERGASLFFVESGSLRMTVQVGLENQRHIQTGLCDLGVSDVFGEACLYQHQQRNVSVMAVSDGTLLEIDGARLSIYLDAHPIQGYLFYKKLFATLNERLNHANHRVEYLLAWGLKVHDISKHL